MIDYIKPTFTLAGLVPVALAGTTCGITETEMKEIFANDFYWTYTDQSFALTEGCQDGKDIDIYCKFTATDNPKFKLIGS